ncbi:MAG: tetratricopeptide repeat protein [Archangium sp.]|nr:tetratricopeptide repeat protein [Archangium sp.]
MLLSLAAALVLAAQPSSPWLDEARALVEQLRFGDAIARLEVARQVRSLEPAELREVLELLAYCQVAEGRRDAAEATYTVMLQADPWMQLSSSPKVLEAFEAAKRRLFPPDYVRLEEKPSPAGFAAFTLIDPWSQVRVVTLFERRNGGEWSETVLTEERSHTWRFPLPIGDGELEWYVEAHGETSLVAHVASREVPRVLKVVQQPVSVLIPAPTPVPVAKKQGQGVRIAGFVVIGVGVALAAVATGLALGGTELRAAARDRARAPGDFADTARAAERDGQAQQTWATGLFIGAGATVATGVVIAW